MHILPTKKECLLFEGKHSPDMLLSLIFHHPPLLTIGCVSYPEHED